MAMVALALVFNTTVYAADAGTSGEWQHRFLLYGWLPSLNGTLNYDIPGGGNSVSADASDIIDNLKMTFMGLYEGRMNEWSFKVDLLYLNVGNSDDNAVSLPGDVKVGADQSMIALAVGLYGGYNAVKTDKVSLDILAGARYLGLDVDARLDLPSGSSLKLSRSVDLWDAIVGIKGSITLSDKWYLPYHFDIGTGDSDLTWQALVAVGYRYNWGDVILAYRHLSYDQGSSGLIQNLELSGPAIGVNFRF
jgi:hypothetical protein